MGTQAGMSLFGQSILGSASRASMKSFQSQVMSSQMSGMSVASDVSDKRSNTSVNQQETHKTAKTKKNVEELTPQDLEKNITIILDETETHTSFKLFGDLAQEGNLINTDFRVKYKILQKPRISNKSKKRMINT